MRTKLHTEWVLNIHSPWLYIEVNAFDYMNIIRECGLCIHIYSWV